MKFKIAVITVLLALLAVSAFGQVSVSTAIEPALNAPARFGVSAAVSANFTANNAASFRVGSGHTFLAGLSRSLVYLSNLAGAECSLVGDVQGGVTSQRRIILYGAAVATDVGQGISISYGLHVNKIEGRPLYPSAYVSVGYSFGR